MEPSGATRRVFISYRRQDSSGHAGRLADHLLDRFGAGSVLMDVESIEAGAGFTEAIERAIADSEAVLVMVGPMWSDAAGPKGERRLDEPADFVRLEIETALRSDIRVIPVLVGGAARPTQIDPSHRRFSAGSHSPRTVSTSRRSIPAMLSRWRESSMVSS